MSALLVELKVSDSLKHFFFKLEIKSIFKRQHYRIEIVIHVWFRSFRRHVFSRWLNFVEKEVFDKNECVFLGETVT